MHIILLLPICLAYRDILEVTATLQCKYVSESEFLKNDITYAAPDITRIKIQDTCS